MMLPPNALDIEESEEIYQKLMDKAGLKADKEDVSKAMPSLAGIKPNRPTPWLMRSFVSNLIRGGF